MFNFYLFVFCTFLCFSCNERPDESKSPTDSSRLHSTLLEVEDNVNEENSDTVLPIKKTIELHRAKNIDIISIEKRVEQDSGENDFSKKCKVWNLRKTDIEQIVRLSQLIDSHEFHYLYYVLPCELKGLLKIDNQQFHYTINAGAFVKLSNSDTTFILGYQKKNWRKFFLTEGGKQ